MMYEDCSFRLVVYDRISRRACADREPPVGAVGITSEFKYNGKVYHVLFFDVDGKLAHLANVLQYVRKLKCSYVVVRTKKGYHVVCFGYFKWKEVQHHWRALKRTIDSKWINLQSKRKYAILRIAGKYSERDIKVVGVNVVEKNDPCLNKLMLEYLMMVR